MAVAVESSGTQAATVGTEHQLAAPTTAAARQLRINRSAMLAGDTLQIRIKCKVLSGDTIGTDDSFLEYGQEYRGAPAGFPDDGNILVSLPVACPFGATFTIKQTAGTGRSFPWSIETL